MTTTPSAPMKRRRRRWPKKPYRPGQRSLTTQAPELKARAKALAIATNTNVNRLLHECLSERLDAIERALEQARQEADVHNDTTRRRRCR